MKKIIRNGLPLWQFGIFQGYPEIDHFITTRKGGFSKSPFGAFNLSYNSGEDANRVELNRQFLAEKLDVQTQKMFYPNQCHTGNVKYLTSKQLDLSNTDALVTSVKETCIAVLVADCVPVLLFDPVKKVVGAIHAGWRGTVAGIVTNAIRVFLEKHNSYPGDILAAIGPSISPSVYQVGPEIIDKVKTYFDTLEGLVTKSDKAGKGYLDLWEANKRQLIHSGVDPKRIEVAGICTFQNNDEFYSARKESVTSGRFACGIMLNRNLE